MTFPLVPLATPDWVKGFVDDTTMDAKITARLNAISAWATSIGQGILGPGVSSASVLTLSTANAFAGLATYTFTLATQRRVRIVGMARYSPATAVNARYQSRPGYNTGASAVIGSFIGVGQIFDMSTTTTNGGSGYAEGDVLLAAGQYTAYMSVRRIGGGAATDTADSFYVAVYDVGSV